MNLIKTPHLPLKEMFFGFPNCRLLKLGPSHCVVNYRQRRTRRTQCGISSTSSGTQRLLLIGVGVYLLQIIVFGQNKEENLFCVIIPSADNFFLLASTFDRKLWVKKQNEF